jgi:glycosyltransferase involved in cell wall biosynthesis
MALGTPVVATPKGAEGLDVTPGHDILIADEPRAFADATARLLADPALRAHLARNGRALVEAKYGWHEIGRRFCDVVDRAARRRGPV